MIKAIAIQIAAAILLLVTSFVDGILRWVFIAFGLLLTLISTIISYNDSQKSQVKISKLEHQLKSDDQAFGIERDNHGNVERNPYDFGEY